MEIVMYTCVNSEGEDVSFSTSSYEDAKSYAQQCKLGVIENKYVFDDSELVNDFREEEEPPLEIVS